MQQAEAIQLIMKIIATEKDSIPYRPALSAIVGSINATILLQQVQYRWTHNDFMPFYKFTAPCSHRLYRQGDSWTEELGFTRHVFSTARNQISIKKPGGCTMQEARYLTTEATDKRVRPVIFWTNAGRLTYYTIHAPAFLQLLQTAYLLPECRITKIKKPDLPKSVSLSYLNPESGFTVNQETGNRITEITTDHHEITQKQQQQAVVDVLAILSQFGIVEPHLSQLSNVHPADAQAWIYYTRTLSHLHNPPGLVVSKLKAGRNAPLMFRLLAELSDDSRAWLDQWAHIGKFTNRILKSIPTPPPAELDLALINLWYEVNGQVKA